MKIWLTILCLSLFVSSVARAEEEKTAPLLVVSDSINPGTGDYLISGIQAAEKQNAPFVVIKMDTPGGLLNTTRQIVQAMLNSKIPVVVFVGPRGAHAGSAGAIITFAADIAVMAPGTNIGAAHPVSAGGGESGDKVMADKIANDTAAFAEGLAKAKGRNGAWAIKAVKESASITSDAALKEGVIDLIAEDTTVLAEKIAGFTFKAPKGGLTSIPKATYKLVEVPPSIKHRVVSFFSDPNLAYMIMTLGGICIWIELSHPGLILPGVVGAIAIMLSLVSFQMMPISYGALAMIFVGLVMLVAELYLPTFGLLGLGGLIYFVIGSLYLMDTNSPEFQISLSLILPTAAVLAGFAFVIGYLVMESRRAQRRSGMESLIGQGAEVREPTTASSGKVFIQGELWNAVSSTETTLSPGERAVVTEVRGMVLVVARG